MNFINKLKRSWIEEMCRKRLWRRMLSCLRHGLKAEHTTYGQTEEEHRESGLGGPHVSFSALLQLDRSQKRTFLQKMAFGKLVIYL